MHSRLTKQPISKDLTKNWRWRRVVGRVQSLARFFPSFLLHRQPERPLLLLHRHRSPSLWFTSPSLRPAAPPLLSAALSTNESPRIAGRRWQSMGRTMLSGGILCNNLHSPPSLHLITPKSLSSNATITTQHREPEKNPQERNKHTPKYDCLKNIIHLQAINSNTTK